MFIDVLNLSLRYKIITEKRWHVRNPSFHFCQLWTLNHNQLLQKYNVITMVMTSSIFTLSFSDQMDTVAVFQCYRVNMVHFPLPWIISAMHALLYSMSRCISIAILSTTQDIYVRSNDKHCTESIFKLDFKCFVDGIRNFGV